MFQIAPFFDMGLVWNVGGNPKPKPKSTIYQFIVALGLGLICQPVGGLNIRLDYAPFLIDLDERDNNVQDDGFYFNVKYYNF